MEETWVVIIDSQSGGRSPSYTLMSTYLTHVCGTVLSLETELLVFGYGTSIVVKVNRSIREDNIYFI